MHSKITFRALAPIATLAALLAAGSAQSATLKVPEQYSTIQAAINAASTGDTVQVGVGVWYGPGNVNLDTLGKAITVKAISGLGSVTLDGGSTSSLFNIHSGETTATVISGFVIRHGAASAGAGIAINNAGPTITNCTFEYNKASVNGGGIYCYSGTPTITNCTFLQNTAQFGAGLYVWYGKAIVSGCTFEDDSASVRGGGLLVQIDTSTITNCSFVNEVASDGGGGAYATLGSKAVFTNCSFNSCNGGNYGGGFLNANSSASQSAPAFNNCSFSANTAANGGGLYIDSASPNIYFCNFDNNTQTAPDTGYSTGGGAIYVASNFATSQPIIYQGVFMQNTATYGGAINSAGNTVIAYSVFALNSTSSLGGAVTIRSGNPVMLNALFAANTTAGYGGAVDLEGGAATITNCTFSANKASGVAPAGDALFAEGGSGTKATVTNCILWDTTHSTPAEIQGEFGTGITVTYSDVNGGYTGTGNINANPLFVNPSIGNFFLGTGSPCLAAGTPSAPVFQTTDLDGNPRSATHPSMGAYEN